MARTPLTAHQRVLLTADDAGTVLGLTAEAFLRDIAPELRAVPVRATWRYSRKELDRWLDENDREAATGGSEPLTSADDLPRVPPRVVDARGRPLLTGAEAADVLGVSVPVFRQDIAPTLRGEAAAGTTRYLREELERWLLRETGR